MTFNISISWKRGDIFNIGHNVITTVRGIQTRYKEMFQFWNSFSVNKELTADIEASLLEIKTLLEDPGR